MAGSNNQIQSKTSGIQAGDFSLTGTTITNTGGTQNIWLTPSSVSAVVGVGTATAIEASPRGLQVARSSGASRIVMGAYINATAATENRYYKSRSTTIGSFTTVQSGDDLFTLTGYGDDGTSFRGSAAITAAVSGTVSTGIVPGELRLRTTNTSGTLTTAITISNAQVSTFAAPLVSPGFACTKVDGTESANAVTASGGAGVITTSSLTTAAGGNYAITWTNTSITSTSGIALLIVGGTNTINNVMMKCVPGSGTATLTIYNNDPLSALDGTLLISYLVF